MHSIMLLFTSYCCSSAFAVEPSVADASINAAKEARTNAVTAYRSKLNRSREIVQERLDTALEECDRARGVYLAVIDPLNKVNSELEVIPLTDSAPELVSANDTYRREITKIKEGYEAQIKEAKKHAVSGGVTLRSVKEDLAKIDAEIKRLDDEAAAEKYRAELAACEAQYATAGLASHCGDQSFRGLGGTDPDWHSMEGLIISRHKRVWLPSEFGACFPEQVKKEEQKPEPSKVSVPPPPFPVVLYPLPE